MDQSQEKKINTRVYYLGKFGKIRFKNVMLSNRKKILVMKPLDLGTLDTNNYRFRNIEILSKCLYAFMRRAKRKKSGAIQSYTSQVL